MLNERKINIEIVGWALIIAIGFLLIQQGVFIFNTNRTPVASTSTQMTHQQASTVKHVQNMLSAEGADYEISYHNGSPAYVNTPITSNTPYTHMEISVNRKGKIESVHYMLNVNTAIPKQEALNNALEYYAVLNNRLQKINMNEDLKKLYPLSDEFLTDYNSSDEWGTLYDNNGLIKEYSITNESPIISKVSFQAIPSTPNNAVLHIFLSI